MSEAWKLPSVSCRLELVSRLGFGSGVVAMRYPPGRQPLGLLGRRRLRSAESTGLVKAVVRECGLVFYLTATMIKRKLSNGPMLDS
jgi:hypothetical protein